MSYQKLAVAIGAFVCLFAAYTFVDRQFRLHHIQEDVIGQQTVPLDHNEQSQVRKLLAQPYHYLDRGRQSIVFESHDGQYVLKFFDLQRYRTNWPAFFSSSHKNRMKKKRDRLFLGYQLAYEQDRDHAFILFQQLIPNPLLDQSVVVNDRFGIQHHIDLSCVPFIIQAKAIPTRCMITHLLNNGDVAGAKQHLRLLLEMYMKEYDRGIYDRDHNFMYNTGFVDGAPIRLDVGRLRADSRFTRRDIALEDLEKIAIDRTDGWLQRHFPQHRNEIMADMHLKMKELKTQLAP